MQERGVNALPARQAFLSSPALAPRGARGRRAGGSQNLDHVATVAPIDGSSALEVDARAGGEVAQVCQSQRLGRNLVEGWGRGVRV